MATGKEWQEHLKTLPLTTLKNLESAIDTFEIEEMVNREYSGYGIFDGFPSLKYLVKDAIRDFKDE